MLIKLFIALPCALFTYQLINLYKYNPVKASSFITLLFCFILSLLTSSQEYFPIIFGSTFIGMSSNKVFSKKQIIVATIFFIPLSSFFLNIFPPIGGILGFSAFVACFLLLPFKILVSSKKRIK